MDWLKALWAAMDRWDNKPFLEKFKLIMTMMVNGVVLLILGVVVYACVASGAR